MLKCTNILLVCICLMVVCNNTADAKCGKDMMIFAGCYQQAYKALQAREPKIMSMTEFQTKISKCFTDNGCKAVKLESEAELSGHRFDATDNETKPKNFNECKLKVQRTARVNIELCIQSKLDKDFKLPQDDKDYVHPKPNIMQSLFAADVWSKSLYRKIYTESVCPKSSNTGKVTSCVNELFEEIGGARTSCRNPFSLVAQYDERLSFLCSADCYNKLSKECRGIVVNAFQGACKCSSQEHELNSEVYEEQFDKCLGEQMSNVTVQRTVESTLREMDRYICHPLPEDPCLKVIKTIKSTVN